MPELESNPEYKEFLRESVELMDTDPLSAGLSGAYADNMSQSPDFAGWISDLSEERRAVGPFSPGHSIRLKRYLAQSALLQAEPLLRNGYPDRDRWRHLLSDIYSSPYHRDQYEIDHTIYNPVTSKPTRYYTALLAAGTLADDDDAPFRHIDVGCGPNFGLALESLFMSEKYPLGSRRLPPLPRLTAGSASEKNILYSVLQRARRREFAESYGVDIFHPQDVLAGRWSSACQTPALLLDPTAKRQRLLLATERDTSANIKFNHADIGAIGLKGKERLGSGRAAGIEMIPLDYSADIATSFFVHYMLDPVRRRNTFDNMQDTARYQFVLDAITRIKQRRKGQHPIDQIEFAGPWPEWSTALVMHDRENPERGQQLIARFRDGACQEMRPEGVLLSLFAKAA